MSAQSSDERTFGQAVELLRRIGQSAKLGRPALQWILNHFVEFEAWVASRVEPALLPVFAGRLGEWDVISDGDPLPLDWNPGHFFAGMRLTCLLESEERYQQGEVVVGRICNRMYGRRQLDQHIVSWLLAYWGGPCIPASFRSALEGGARIVAPGTIFLNPSGVPCVICLSALPDGQIDWGFRPLTTEFDNRILGLVAADSFELPTR